MDYYLLKIGDLERRLPIVNLGHKIRVASVNLLGDRELVVILARLLSRKLKRLKFDYLVGPEVKVVPLLHEVSGLLGKPRYIVCRKQIHGYMLTPVKTKIKPGLVIDGQDAAIISGKRVVVIDDVVSSGKTMVVVDELMKICNAKVVGHVAVFKQGSELARELPNLVFLKTLPVFGT